MKRMAWLLGWAIPEEWFGAQVQTVFPDANHLFFPAAPDALDRLAAAGPFDGVVGYSLGSLLLLCDADRAEQLGRVLLLAPIFAYPREKHAGGRITRSQVRLMARKLRQEPRTALEDFYRLARLDVSPEPPIETRLKLWLWGLERLECAEVSPPTLPSGWSAWCGADDPLLDASRLQVLSPGITVVPGAGHHPGPLLRAMMAEVLR